jgi:hypothetical protein
MAQTPQFSGAPYPCDYAESPRSKQIAGNTMLLCQCLGVSNPPSLGFTPPIVISLRAQACGVSRSRVVREGIIGLAYN